MSGRFDPTKYVTVAERLQEAATRTFEITDNKINFVNDNWGYIQSIIKLDGKQYIGTASFRLDLQGARAQATNPIEDAETSAVGRALAMAGISSDRSVASLEEVQEAQRRADAKPLSEKVVADNVVTLPSGETSIGEMLDAINKSVDGLDQAKIIEFLKAKKRDVGDAVDVWTLPEATIRELHEKLSKLRPAIEKWMNR